LKRNGIFERDGYRCVYCGEQFGEDELTLDHVQPRVRGGDRSEGNLVTACRACNTLKGQRRLSVFLHESPSARANFSRYARFVWPRLLLLLRRELAALDRAAEVRQSRQSR
jgi:5-methylcytosine-specific restriction endonuclease McrA